VRELLPGLVRNFVDRPRYAFRTRFPWIAKLLRSDWTALANRHERIYRKAGQRGFICDWTDTSNLFLCEADREVGARVLSVATREWPIRFVARPVDVANEPVVTFVIGHRGTQRSELLRSTIRSIAAQTVPSELIVVEQDAESFLTGSLPAWVRVVHQRSAAGLPYNRGAAFNLGAALSRAPYLILHDNDMPVPADYAKEVARLLANDFDAARLQRLIFYLDDSDTRSVMSRGLTSRERPVAVVQNAVGGTTAVRRDVFERIGGFDEDFVGWGGEDNEFFDRLRSTRLHEAAYLPFLHLNHPVNAEREDRQQRSELLESKLQIPAQLRIAKLRESRTRP